MPIKPELRYFYPIDWPQISHWVRFVRAKGHCQVCGRPHGETVHHLGDGRWWDETEQTWRDGRGRKVPSPAPDVPLRTTKVVLAAAHLDHDPAHCGRRHRNVRALCQRCHLLHDRPEHRRRIRLTLRRRRATGRSIFWPLPFLVKTGEPGTALSVAGYAAPAAWSRPACRIRPGDIRDQAASLRG